MAATKRNAGLTSAVPRATLNDEELVILSIVTSNVWENHSKIGQKNFFLSFFLSICVFIYFISSTTTISTSNIENACLQKSFTSLNISYIIYYATQFCSMDSYFSYLLL